MIPIRHLLCLVVFLLPMLAHAQTPQIDHDWRINVAGGRYGLLQTSFGTKSTISTYVHFYKPVCVLRISAPLLATAMMVPCVAAIFGLVRLSSLRKGNESDR